MFSSFYKDKKGKRRVYSTKRLTRYHEFLRDEFKARTFEHNESAPIYFVPGMPLEQPCGIIREIK